MNRMNPSKDHKGKDHKIGTYEINKTSLSCFDKIYIENSGSDGLALAYQS